MAYADNHSPKISLAVSCQEETNVCYKVSIPRRNGTSICYFLIGEADSVKHSENLTRLWACPSHRRYQPLIASALRQALCKPSSRGILGVEGRIWEVVSKPIIS